LLPDGRVLVSGGCSTLNCYPGCPTDCPDVSPSKTSAEIFDPVTGRWTPTGNMAFSQQQGASVLLPGGPASVCGPNCGKVLVVGKGATLTGETPPTDAELYDPRSGTWSPTAPTVHPRTFPAAVVLRSGKVLLASTAIDQPLNAIPGELYDPATGTWAPTGNAELTPSIGETATLLPDGRVLAIAADPYGIGKEVELYDPTALPDPTNPAVRGGAWKATAGPTEGRTRNTATRLGDGTILIVGGNRPPVATAELYDEKTATWASAGTMAGARSLDPIQSTGQPTFTATLLKDGTVLVVGASYQVSRLTTTFNSHVINGFKVTDPAQYGPSAELYTPGSGDSGSAPRTFVLVLGGAAALAVLAAVALARRRNQRPGERVETAPG